MLRSRELGTAVGVLPALAGSGWQALVLAELGTVARAGCLGPRHLDHFDPAQRVAAR
jgi:hypothetical protein